MKKTNAALLLCLVVCLSVFCWATACAQITAPVRASECEIPAVFDRLAEVYGAAPQITGVEKTGDAQYSIRFDADPLKGQFVTPGSAYLVSIGIFSTRDGARFPVTARSDDGLTITVDGVQAMEDGLEIEIMHEYSDVPLDEGTVFAYKTLYYDLQGNPLRMILDGRDDPTSYTFEYVNGNPALVQYMDDEYDNTGERIFTYYSRSTGELTEYEYDFYVNGANGDRIGSVHSRYNAYGDLKSAYYWPEASEFVDCEWDLEQGRWFEQMFGESRNGSRNYDVEVPAEVPDPTAVEPPVALPKPEGYVQPTHGEFGDAAFFGVPDIALPMTAQEALALSAPLPFDITALPKPVSYGKEGDGFLVQLSWDEAEAVRAALGEDGALSGEFDCYYLVEDEQFGLIGEPGNGPVDFERLSARIEAPGSTELDGYSPELTYDVQTPDGSFAVTYLCMSEDGDSGMEVREIDVANGKYTHQYRPDGSLSGLAIRYATSGSDEADCTCSYDETGALSGYEYDLTTDLSASFDTNGLSAVYYSTFVEVDEHSLMQQWLVWTPDGGWTLEEWDDATGEPVYTPCEAPDGVDLSRLTPLI